MAWSDLQWPKLYEYPEPQLSSPNPLLRMRGKKGPRADAGARIGLGCFSYFIALFVASALIGSNTSSQSFIPLALVIGTGLFLLLLALSIFSKQRFDNMVDDNRLEYEEWLDNEREIYMRRFTQTQRNEFLDKIAAQEEFEEERIANMHIPDLSARINDMKYFQEHGRYPPSSYD